VRCITIPYKGHVAGVDEAGRGPLAGPVYAAAVILDPKRPIRGLADSKLLKPQVRGALAESIQARALAWSVAKADIEEIETHNILGATLLAMQRAVSTLQLLPQLSLIDGNRCPPLPCPATAIVRGDSKVPAISAASILAKVARDREMLALDQRYPIYRFAQNKGYGTAFHLAALKAHGPCPCHRRSFEPVRDRLPAGTTGLYL
jgi:ribonuclease HII